MQKQARAEIIVGVVQACPDAAMQLDKNGMLLLHFRMIKQARAELILVVVQACPDGAMQPGKNGQLLLHFRMQRQAGAESILVVVQACSDAAKQLPINLAPGCFCVLKCSSSCPYSSGCLVVSGQACTTIKIDSARACLSWVCGSSPCTAWDPPVYAQKHCSPLAADQQITN